MTFYSDKSVSSLDLMIDLDVDMDTDGVGGTESPDGVPPHPASCSAAPWLPQQLSASPTGGPDMSGAISAPLDLGSRPSYVDVARPRAPAP